MNTADDFDPLAPLLARREWGEQNETLRNAVLAQTASVLRQRLMVRRTAWAAALLGCYLAGAANVGIWYSLVRSAPPLADNNSGTTDLTPDDSSPRDGGANAGKSSLAKSQATQRDKSQFEELRDAGHQALRERNDLVAAIRFYAEALEVATPQELTISTASDDWLLMSLKDAHMKERSNADPHSKS